MLRFSLAWLLLAATSMGRAQDAAVPLVTPQRFSQVAGKKYTISSSASPTEVRVEGPITLKVRILGQGPEKYHPERNNLQIFPEDVADDFFIEGVPEEDRPLPTRGSEKGWEFVYRLRPKNANVKVIPELQLLYFVPGAPASKQFQSSFTEEIPIKVTPRQEVTADKLALRVVQAPARFYQLRPVEDVLRDDTLRPPPSPGLLAAFLALPPVGCLLWYRVWRRRHPNAAESRQWRRSRAARLALSYLEKQSADVLRTRAAAVDFLRQRLDLPPREPTPREVARHLKRLGVAKALVADWAAFLQTCDRFQFAPSLDQPALPLNGEAIRLINALEADPCVTR